MVDIMSEEDIEEIDTTTGLCVDDFFKDTTEEQDEKIKANEDSLKETILGLEEVVEELSYVTQEVKERVKIYFDFFDSEDGKDGYFSANIFSAEAFDYDRN
eukprot:1514363-Ditylum_brightwellii.AAC.1